MFANPKLVLVNLKRRGVVMTGSARATTICWPCMYQKWPANLRAMASTCSSGNSSAATPLPHSTMVVTYQTSADEVVASAESAAGGNAASARPAIGKSSKISSSKNLPRSMLAMGRTTRLFPRSKTVGYTLATTRTFPTLPWMCPWVLWLKRMELQRHLRNPKISGYQVSKKNLHNCFYTLPANDVNIALACAPLFYTG